MEDSLRGTRTIRNLAVTSALFDVGPDEVDSWRKDAACREYPTEFFYQEIGATAARALAVCNGLDRTHARMLGFDDALPVCPVREACLKSACELNETYGVWGGQTPRQRRNTRKKLLAAGLIARIRRPSATSSNSRAAIEKRRSRAKMKEAS